MKEFWVGWASRRLLAGRKGGRGRTAFLLSVAGIALGVMTLNGVLAVMNGFQQGFIRSILEIGSYHLRWIPQGEGGEQGDGDSLAAFFLEDKEVASAIPFREGQTLLKGSHSRPAGALIRGVPADLLQRSPALGEYLLLVEGEFDLRDNGVVLGNELARELGVFPGDEIKALALGVPGFSPENLTLVVRGIFRSGYLEYDSSLLFLNLNLVSSFLGEGPEVIGLKLHHPDRDRGVVERLQNAQEGHFLSWRETNRAFFGALRTEKTMMMFLIGLVFIVVAVNIENALRRLAAERREDIAVLKAAGASSGAVRSLFLRQGLVLGGAGGLAGTLLGLLAGQNINLIFALLERVVNGVRVLGASFKVYPKDAFYMAEVPTEIMLTDVLLILAAAVLFSLLAAWRASSKVAHIRPAEILRSE